MENCVNSPSDRKHKNQGTRFQWVFPQVWKFWLGGVCTSVVREKEKAPTSSWSPFGTLDFVFRAIRALRPFDPRKGDITRVNTKTRANTITQDNTITQAKTITRANTITCAITITQDNTIFIFYIHC